MVQHTCSMKSHCKLSRNTLHFALGLILGVCIGCSITLTYSINSVAPGSSFDCRKLGLAGGSVTAEKNVPTEGDRAITKKSKRDMLEEQVQWTSRAEETQDSLNLMRFIDPTFSIHRKPSVRGSEYLEANYTFRETLLVAVVSSNSHVSRMEAIYDTWARSVSQVLFFTGSEGVDSTGLDGLPVVKLPGITDESSGVHKTFTVLKHVHRHYSKQFHWFMQVNDDAYLRGHKLQELLSQMDPTEMVYMGHPAPTSPEDSAQLNLLPHERYCKGGPGVLFSRAALQVLSSKLNLCIAAVQRHNRNSIDSQWDRPDVELGRCVSRGIGVQCSSDNTTKQFSQYFVEDTTGQSKSLIAMKSLPLFKKLLTLSPITSDNHMYMVHYYYTLLEYTDTSLKTEKLRGTIQQLCQQLPKDLQRAVGDGECPTGQSDFQPAAKQNSKYTTPTIPSHFRPQTRFQVLGWNYFDALALYEDESLNPRSQLKTYKYNLLELQRALLEAVKVANKRHPVKIKFKQLLNGYVRHNSLVGSEYIIDAEFVEVRNPKRHISKRVHLVRPLTPYYTVQATKTDASEMVHFVVPLSGVTSRFDDFMQMYEQSCLSNDENTHLVLAVFGESDVQFVQRTVSTYTDRYPDARITVLPGEGEFSRAKALDLGLSSLQDDDLAFLCDVDIHVDVGFLPRCRRNAIQGKRVYYPEVFKLYNMDYVYRSKHKPRIPTIIREHGHWGHYAFGMACIYKSDYKSTGGFDVSLMGWGGEDVELYEKVLKTDLEVFRAPDVGLIHQWHSKNCAGHTSLKQYEQCMMSKAEVLADRRELARYIFDLEESYQKT